MGKKKRTYNGGVKLLFELGLVNFGSRSEGWVYLVGLFGKGVL